jgi:hypothetical protein
LGREQGRAFEESWRIFGWISTDGCCSRIAVATIEFAHLAGYEDVNDAERLSP